MKKHLTIFLLYCSLCTTLTAQTSLIDSLKNIINHSPPDTAKVIVYIRFSRALLNGANRDLEQVMHYAQEGLALAEQLRFDKGRADLLRTIGNIFRFQNDFAKAIEHYQQSLIICEKLKDTEGMALNYFNTGVVNRVQSKYYDALENFQKALSLWKKSGNTNNISTTYSTIIDIYYEIKELDLVWKYIEEALHLAIETGNRRREAILYDRLARFYYYTDNLETSEEYFNKSLNIHEELGDQVQIASILSNIAFLFYSDNPEMHIEMNQKAAAILERIMPAHFGLANIYHNISAVYFKKEQIDSARYYTEKALSKAILSGEAPTIANAYNRTGLFYMKTSDIISADKNFRNAYDITLKHELFRERAEALSGLSETSYMKGDYKSAYEYLRLYQSVNDSLIKQDSINNIRELTLKFEFERDMAEKNETINAQQQSIRYQKNMVAIISGALICTAILLVFIFRSNKRNRQANVKLEEQHREISCINDKLKELHAVKDKLFSVVAHDLRSPIASLMSVLKLLHDNVLDAEKQSRMLKDVSKQVDGVYGLLDNLLRWAKSQMQRIAPMPVYFDAYEESLTVTDILQTIAANKNIVLENRIARQQVYADSDMFAVVVRNLIMNALKYTSAVGEVTIDSELTGDMLVIAVKDNGMGMSQEVQDKLFKLAETKSKRGTGNETGSGLGLVLCADFVKANGGSIWFTSVQGEGSTFYFSVPVES